jgi:hypothetical protein
MYVIKHVYVYISGDYAKYLCVVDGSVMYALMYLYAFLHVHVHVYVCVYLSLSVACWLSAS